MTFFTQTERPQSSFMHKRNDPNDVRLGETVLFEEQDYVTADAVLLGFPQDIGVQRNGGRVGAAQAPDVIRQHFYKLVNIPGLRIFDLGNTRVDGSLEEIHQWHQEVVRTVLSDDKILIVLGGGNDTSYPDCSGLAMATRRPILAFNIDAHLDVRVAPSRNSGTPYRQLIEEKYLLPENFYEVAYQPFANSTTYLDYCLEKGITAYDLHHVQDVGIGSLLKTIVRSHRLEAIFWGLDMDVVRAADAPGVSAINPSGLSASEFIHIGSVAGSFPQTRIFEITEVNPTYDQDNRTARLAAATIWHFLSTLQQNIRNRHK